jgi:glycosyltransferase involved in cell wall biosynthesis
MSAKGMHILYVFPEPLPLNRARGVQVTQFVRALADEGVCVTLAYVPAVGGHPFAPLGIEVPPGVALLPLSRQLPGRLASLSLKSHRLFMWRLARWIRQAQASRNGPDLVFFRHVKAAAWCASAFPGLPLVYEAHEVFAQTAKPSQRRRISRMEGNVLRHAALIVSNSQGSASGLRQTYGLPRLTLVLPNGVDFPVMAPEKDWTKAARRIVYAGSLFGWKGVDDLVDAFNFLPGHMLTVVGGTAEQIGRLEARRKAGGGEIIFLGHQPHYEVQRRLAAACIAVLPNRPDKDSQFTSPLKLFEYLAYGCVVVATDLPAMHEVLAAGDAIWAQPSDPQSMAEAIVGACQSPDHLRDLGLRGRELVRDRTWKRRAERFLDLVRAALAGNRQERRTAAPFGEAE